MDRLLTCHWQLNNDGLPGRHFAPQLSLAGSKPSPTHAAFGDCHSFSLDQGIGL
ncbi:MULTISPECIES: hypothetical protein [unclassified Rhizobium]|uniref:hypothetical protein n=1 Tax=unclassified Rhizobium TaxID=2613769 RepID=UPI00138F2FFC|nr:MULTISPECIES: hypothetical protein [unclassified Rhizobium]